MSGFPVALSTGLLVCRSRSSPRRNLSRTVLWHVGSETACNQGDGRERSERRPEARPDLRRAVHHHVHHVDPGARSLPARSRRSGRVHHRRREGQPDLPGRSPGVLPHRLRRRNGCCPLPDCEAAERSPRDRLRRLRESWRASSSRSGSSSCSESSACGTTFPVRTTLPSRSPPSRIGRSCSAPDSFRWGTGCYSAT